MSSWRCLSIPANADRTVCITRWRQETNKIKETFESRLSNAAHDFFVKLSTGPTKFILYYICRTYFELDGKGNRPFSYPRQYWGMACHHLVRDQTIGQAVFSPLQYPLNALLASSCELQYSRAEIHRRLHKQRYSTGNV